MFKGNRRQFLKPAVHSAIAAGAATIPSIYSNSSAQGAQTYDLIIRGGRVIDPSLHLDAIRAGQRQPQALPCPALPVH